MDNKKTVLDSKCYIFSRKHKHKGKEPFSKCPTMAKLKLVLKLRPIE